MEWWNAGVATVNVIRFTGNRAIRRHHDETDQRSQMNVALGEAADEPWAPHIWYRDPRFTAYIPKGNETVLDIAVSGHPDLRRSLCGTNSTGCGPLWPPRPRSASLTQSPNTSKRSRGSTADAFACSWRAPD